MCAVLFCFFNCVLKCFLVPFSCYSDVRLQINTKSNRPDHY